MQALMESGISNSQGAANLEGQLEGNAASTMSHPLDLSPDALQAEINKQNAVTMDPQWQRLQDQTEQQAYDRGLTPGSEGYSHTMSDFGLQRDQAYASSYGSAEQQAQAAKMAEYTAPLNALTALRSNSQVSQPGVGTLAPTAQTGVQPTNISGLIEQQYQQQLAASNATMGGLFGLGGSALQLAGAFA